MLPGFLFGQLITLKKDPPKHYSFVAVFDSTYGINLYDKLVFSIGGDSMRFDQRGYNAQGWLEDQYLDGKVLHKGFYVDGQLTVFKNYYPNGQMERFFRSTDSRRNEMVIYYEDGKIKSEIFYFKGNPQKLNDYYPNGSLEYAEEYDKDMQYLFKRNGFLPDGKPKFIFELVDKRKKTYLKKEFFDNGKLKEQGGMKFIADGKDYVKEGSWEYFDENGGLLRKENYHLGSLTDN